MPDIARDPAILNRKRLRQARPGRRRRPDPGGRVGALARMEPAAPSVERATVLVDTVKRGSIVRQVRGVGTLVPEDTRWLPATTDGRVERILLRPGRKVGADSVILELSNPQVEQEALNARLALQSARAALDNLRVQLQNDLLTQQSQAARIEADFEQARMEAEANEALAKEQLVSELIRKQSQLKAETLKKRVAHRDAAADRGRASRSRRACACSRPPSIRRRPSPILQASRLRALQVTPGLLPACSSRCRSKSASAWRPGRTSRAWPIPAG